MYKFVASVSLTATLALAGSSCGLPANEGPSETAIAIESGPVAVSVYLETERSQETLDEALEYAAKLSDIEVLRLLVDAGANPMDQDESVGLMHMLALSKADDVEAAEYLLSVGATPCQISDDERERFGPYSALAERRGQPGVAEVLREAEELC